MPYGIKSKIVSYYKWVICYRIEMILDFQPWQLEAAEVLFEQKVVCLDQRI